MKQLFISLYLLLSLSVTGLGWTLDSLWKNSIADNTNFDAPLIALAQILALQPKPLRQQSLNNLSNSLQYPLTLMDIEQVALANKDQLSNDHIIAASFEDGMKLQFIAVGDQVLIAGPISLDPDAAQRSIFSVFFYLCLGLIILVWVWPLSRDLKTLKHATKQFGEAKWQTRIDLPTHSQVMPLAKTFNNMAAHISMLIENQKHLSNAVSHEIRTPLARLRFALALLPQFTDSNDKEQQRESFINDMQQDIKEMDDLINELLNYASLEVNHSHQQLVHCDLNSIIQHTIKRLQSNHSILITFSASSYPISILAEPILIERAFQNLIVNAQKFANEIINVEIQCFNQEVLLHITNDGELISMEHRTQIFEPFYRIEGNGKQGFGLGLAIVKRIMKRHKGNINVSIHQSMTRFTLSLPQQDNCHC